MRITITDRLVGRKVLEGSSCSFTASFYNDSTDSWSAVTPTTVRYRLDDPDTGEVLVNWTYGTPGTTLAIAIPGTANTVNNCRDQSARELTVEADTGSGQYRAKKRFWVCQSAVDAA